MRVLGTFKEVSFNILSVLKIILQPGFGMTECSFGVSVVFPDYDIESNSVGRPLDHTEVREDHHLVQ